MAELNRKEARAQKKQLKKKMKEKQKRRKKTENGLDLCLVVLCFLAFLAAAVTQMAQEWMAARKREN